MANRGRSGRGGSRLLAGFEMGHHGRAAFPLALTLGALSDPPGLQMRRVQFAALLLPYLSIFAVNRAACVRSVPESRLLGLGGEDRGARRCPRSAAAQSPPAI